MSHEPWEEWDAKFQQTIVGDYLSIDQRTKLCHVAKLVECRIGELLFREGGHSDCSYVLLHGQLDLLMKVPGRGDQRILTVGPGDFLAWSSVLGDGTMTCSALCRTDCQLFSLHAASLKSLLETDHELGYQFMRMLSGGLSHRLMATRLQMLDLFAPNNENHGLPNVLQKSS